MIRSKTFSAKQESMGCFVDPPRCYGQSVSCLRPIDHTFTDDVLNPRLHVELHAHIVQASCRFSSSVAQAISWRHVAVVEYARHGQRGMPWSALSLSCVFYLGWDGRSPKSRVRVVLNGHGQVHDVDGNHGLNQPQAHGNQTTPQPASSLACRLGTSSPVRYQASHRSRSVPIGYSERLKVARFR
ncbi:hypothetical protein J1614_001563 [Plenodomus biglobosus]|nr:hypothetical protein J1614_001563 [Plenodomus biglobosus]